MLIIDCLYFFVNLFYNMDSVNECGSTSCLIAAEKDV